MMWSMSYKLDLISHSYSVYELKWIFTKILPSLEGKTLLDVGSRFGCVLYAAAEFTNASRIIGVEMNSDLCTVQQAVCEQYKYTDTVEIIQSDIRTQTQLLQNADVIMMNNVFEHFVEPEQHAKCWDVVVGNVRRKGQVLVLVPSLEESLGDVPPGWVEEISWDVDEELAPDELDVESLRDIHLYRVL
eukprot:sb/3471267/